MGETVRAVVIMAGSYKMLSRGLSTSSSLSQLVKSPAQVFGTEGRYAAALYSAATKQKALEAVEKDLKTMKGQKSLISYHVKPEVMGGMVVSIGDRFVDMSTASKVKKYTDIIQAAA